MSKHFQHPKKLFPNHQKPDDFIWVEIKDSWRIYALCFLVLVINPLFFDLVSSVAKSEAELAHQALAESIVTYSDLLFLLMFSAYKLVKAALGMWEDIKSKK